MKIHFKLKEKEYFAIVDYYTKHLKKYKIKKAKYIFFTPSFFIIMSIYDYVKNWNFSLARLYIIIFFLLYNIIYALFFYDNKNILKLWYILEFKIWRKYHMYFWDNYFDIRKKKSYKKHNYLNVKKFIEEDKYYFIYTKDSNFYIIPKNKIEDKQFFEEKFRKNQA